MLHWLQVETEERERGGEECALTNVVLRGQALDKVLGDGVVAIAVAAAAEGKRREGEE